MPSIYDVAAGLDTRGVIGPALETGARIRLAEQTALEQPQRFAREKQTWGRQDEMYAMQKKVTEEAQALDHLRQALALNQTAIGARKTFRGYFPAGLPPELQSLGDDLDRAVIHPEEFPGLKEEVLDYLGKKGDQRKQAQTMLEGILRSLNTEQQEAGAMQRTKAEIASQEGRTQATIASQEKIAQLINDRANERAQQTGIDAVEMGKIYESAKKMLEFQWLDQDNNWKSTAPFMKVIPHTWPFSDAYVVDETKFNEKLDEEVNKLLQKTGALRTQEVGRIGVAGTKPKFSVTQP